MLHFSHFLPFFRKIALVFSQTVVQSPYVSGTFLQQTNVLTTTSGTTKNLDGGFDHVLTYGELTKQSGPNAMWFRLLRCGMSREGNFI